MARDLLVLGAVVASLGLCVAAQSPFSIDGNIRLEVSAQKNSKDTEKNGVRKSDAWKSLFKDFKAGSCRAQASPMVPSSSWPARGEAAVTVCRP
jgi:hypothetical protein